MLWGKNGDGQKLQKIDWLIRKSFANVKRDTSVIFQWLNYFYAKGSDQDKKLEEMEAQLSVVPKREDIIRLMNEQIPYEAMARKVSELQEKMLELERRQIGQEAAPRISPVRAEMPQPAISEIHLRLEKLEQKKVLMREKMMKKLTRNSKEYAKSVILSYIRKYQKISAMQLREIVVDEQNFCSKSTFYRLLSEIEERDDISIVRQGKEKYCMTKIRPEL